MPVPPKRLPEAGQYASLFRWLNALLAYVVSLKPLQSAGTLTTHGPRGVSRTAAGGGVAGEDGPPVTVKQLRVKDATTSGSYIKCVSFDAAPDPGVEGETYIYVARPYKLRTTILTATIDSVAVAYTYASKIQRTATRAQFTSGGQTYPVVAETQKIVPRYLVDDVIYAVEVDDESDLNLTDPDGNTITLVDLNLDARAWCRSFIQ